MPLPHTHKTLCLTLVALAALGMALTLRPSDVAATPPAAPEVVAQPVSAAPSDAGTAPQAPVVESTTSTIVFATSPPATATVTWGRKLVGRITPGKPLVVVRPRDSGPLDVMVRATDYLAVQTRAHTFSDTRVMVKLTPLDKKSELLGYRAPLDAGVETPEQTAALNAMTAADGGVVQPAPMFQVVPPEPPPSPWFVP